MIYCVIHASVKNKSLLNMVVHSCNFRSWEMELKASPGYIVKLCLKNKQTGNGDIVFITEEKLSSDK